MRCCVNGPILWVVDGARLSREDSAGEQDSGLGQEEWIGGRRGGAIGCVEREGVGRGGARGTTSQKRRASHLRVCRSLKIYSLK